MHTYANNSRTRSQRPPDERPSRHKIARPVPMYKQVVSVQFQLAGTTTWPLSIWPPPLAVLLVVSEVPTFPRSRDSSPIIDDLALLLVHLTGLFEIS
jgi:hypothetical protein